jgi:alkylhydroperoxidase family enzyme
MKKIKIHSIESAPEGSKSSLEESVKSFGMLPGLHGVLAEAPKALEGYKTLHKLFSETSFNAEELTVVWQTINVEHECHYCVPAHTGIAHIMNVDPALSEALRNKQPMTSDKLQVLHETTLEIVRQRGHLSDEQAQAFYNVGYGNQQLLEIVLGLAQKVMSNYTNHLANTPVDKAFEKFTWNKN